MKLFWEILIKKLKIGNGIDLKNVSSSTFQNLENSNQNNNLLYENEVSWAPGFLATRPGGEMAFRRVQVAESNEEGLG